MVGSADHAAFGMILILTGFAFLAGFVVAFVWELTDCAIRGRRGL